MIKDDKLYFNDFVSHYIEDFMKKYKLVMRKLKLKEISNE